MRYPNLKKQKEQKFTIDTFSHGIDKTAEDTVISVSDNLVCTAGALTNRPSLKPIDDEFFYKTDSSLINNAEITSATVFLDGEYYKVSVFYCAEEGKYAEYKFFLFNDEGKTIQVAPLKFSVNSNSQYKKPRSITVFSAAPKFGCGIYAFVSLENEAAATKDEKYSLDVYELAYAMDEWRLYNFDDLYVPVCYVHGKGSIYEEGVDFFLPAEYRESVNILNNAGRFYFDTDGISSVYYLPEDIARDKSYEYFNCKLYLGDGVMLDFTIGPNGSMSNEVLYDGKKVTVNYFPDRSMFFFGNFTPPTCLQAGNMVITIQFRCPENVAKFASIDKSAWFSSHDGGGHLYLAGNSDNPSQICVSEKNNPFYFTEGSCHQIGDPSQKITAIARQNKSLVIFKEKEIYCADNVSGKLKLTHLHSSIGCDLPKTISVCENRLVWATTDKKVYTLNALSDYGAVAVYGMSRAIDSILEKENFKNAVATYCNRKYYLFLDDKAYVLDLSGALLQSNREFVTAAAWYKWSIPPLVDIKLAYPGKTHVNVVCAVPKTDGYYTAQFSGTDGIDTYLDYNGVAKNEVVKSSFSSGIFYNDDYANRKIITKLFANIFAERDVFIDFLDEGGSPIKSTVININYNRNGLMKLYKILPFVRCLGIKTNFRANGNIRLNKLTFFYKENI